MDHFARLDHFRGEATAFERAVRHALGSADPAPPVPSCPGWSVPDLVGLMCVVEG